MKKRLKPAPKAATPLDGEVLRAYIHKNASYNRTKAKRIKRALRKLAHSA